MKPTGVTPESKPTVAELPTDPAVKMGTLPNGIKYYIRQNNKPENKVELRLAVNVGSLMEDETQLGLAHFVEHMAFNGTKNFAKNELVSYLQSVGVKFGAHLNAYTSFDETVYMLSLPTDKQEVVDKGFQILEDWAHNVSFSDEEIDKERGVVIEEWRLGQGADQRMRDRWLPIVLKGSRYADRLPIGKKEILETFSYETIRRFYRDWYRPDLMSVVVVGDIDVAQMEAKIKTQFGGIPAAKKPKPRPVYSVPDQPGTQVLVTSDKEATFNRISVYNRQPDEPFKTVEDYRRQLTYQLFGAMLNQRLEELRQSPQPPFIFGNVGYGGFVRTKNVYSASAFAPEGGIAKALETLMLENRRVALHGFLASEMVRVKTEMLAGYENAYNERDKTESENYSEEYVNHFLEEEPFPGIAYEYDMVQKILPTITLQEVNALAKKWITTDNRVVVITAPEKEGVKLPTEAEISALLAKTDAATPPAYQDALTASSLMEKMPKAGQIVSETKQEFDVVELTLSNGARVILKPTDFKNDEVLFSAYSPGGSSLYNDADYVSANYATRLVTETGAGGLSAVDMQKLMAGKNASVAPYISSLYEGFQGGATPKDLETMFQLVYMYFTSPRKDEQAFQSYVTKNKALYQNLLSNPQYYFMDQRIKLMSQNHPRAGGFPTVAELEAINLDRAYSIYAERFANAGDFTFMLVGSFDVEQVKPLIATYLGGLPGQPGSPEKWKDVGLRYPKEKVEKVMNKGKDPKSQVMLAFPGEFAYDRKEVYYMSTVADVLDIRLIEILREEKGGVYGVGASVSAEEEPVGRYLLDISFPCSPDNAESLAAAAVKALQDLQANGPTEAELTKVKEAQKVEMKENLKQNRYWLSRLTTKYRSGMDISDTYEYEKRIEALTKEQLQQAAKKYFDPNKVVKMVLMPE